MTFIIILEEKLLMTYRAQNLKNVTKVNIMEGVYNNQKNESRILKDFKKSYNEYIYSYNWQLLFKLSNEIKDLTARKQ